MTTRAELTARFRRAAGGSAPTAGERIVVVGGGHNGLAAGVVLADAGHRVTVLERNDQAGGAVRTAEVTAPGFRHDLMATNLNLFAGSSFFAEFGERLAAHGLEFAPSDRPVCALFEDGRGLSLSTDLDETVAAIAAIEPSDADVFRAMCAEFAEVAPHLFPMLGSPVPSLAATRNIARAARALGRDWPHRMARLVAQSSREFTQQHFVSPEVQSLFAAWGMHLDFAPGVPGGALFPYLETMACQANGMVLGAGGADTIITAMTGLLTELGGELHTGTAVESVTVSDGRASGVVLAGGESIAADRVVATLTPAHLFRGLVGAEHLDAEFCAKVDAFRHGPGTVMVHLALDGPAPWTHADANRAAYVHIGPYMDDMDLAYTRAEAGLLPERPLLVVGQPTVVDPSRAPDGKHVLWVQARMFPAEIAGDAAGEIDARDWDAAREPVADRIMALLEQDAPGLADRVLGRHVITPRDLEALDVNLVGGDSLGGSHHLMQNFVLRPFPGWSRYKTPIDGLYLCGASTWPGGGLGAGSGYLVGKMLSPRPGLRDRLRSR